MKLLIKIGVGVSVALNLFVFTVSMYGLLTQDKRIEVILVLTYSFGKK